MTAINLGGRNPSALLNLYYAVLHISEITRWAKRVHQTFQLRYYVHTKFDHAV